MFRTIPLFNLFFVMVLLLVEGVYPLPFFPLIFLVLRISVDRIGWFSLFLIPLLMVFLKLPMW